MDFIFDATSGLRLISADFPQPATDTPSAKLAGFDASGIAVPIPLRIQYAKPANSGSAYVPCAAPGGMPLKFALKPARHFSDTAFDVYTDVFTAPTDPTQAGAFYVGSILIDSTALRALFPLATDGTSPDSVTLIGEVTSGGLATKTFVFVVENNIIKGTEPPAVASPGPGGYPSGAAVSAALAQLADGAPANHYIGDDAKLSDSGDPGQPTIRPGQCAVIDGEGGRVEQYLGPVVGATGASCTVSGAGSTGVNGVYCYGGLVNGKPCYYLTSNGMNTGDPTVSAISWVDGQWKIFNAGGDVAYFSSQDVAAPFLVTAWETDAGTAPAPAVTRNDVASDANWLVLLNAINAAFINNGSDVFVVDGVSIPNDGTPTPVWFKPQSFNLSTTAGQIFVTEIDVAGSAVSIAGFVCPAGASFMPIVFAPRATGLTLYCQ